MHPKLFLNNLSLSELSSVYTCPIPGKGYPFSNKGRIHSGFIYTLEGAETYHLSYGSFRATPGSVLFLPQGASYRVTLEGSRSLVIVIDFDFSSPAAPAFLVDTAKCAPCSDLFRELESKWTRKSSWYLPECKSTFYRLVALLSQQLSQDPTESVQEKLEWARSHLRENCTKPELSMEKLAQELGMSRRYLEVLFRRNYGTSPKNYLLDLKMERAKELLLCEKLLLKDVASMLGYSDPYHFGKVFKAKIGIPPGEYRRLHGL